MKVSNFLLVIFSVVMLCSLSSAALIVNSSTSYINKTYSVNSTFQIQITNPDAFTYYNISIDSNPNIYIEKIAQLNQNQVATVTAVAYGDVNTNLTYRIRGYYVAGVGQVPQTRSVNITSYSLVPTPCDLSVIKGDTIVWATQTTSAIELRQSPYTAGLNTLATISSNNTFSKVMNSVGPFAYRFYVSSFSPGECTINVLNDTGFVNNPLNDGFLNTFISTAYSPTTLSSTVLISNYTMDFYGSQDGLMTLSNTGNQTAHNVHLGGEWLSFNSNDFNLNPGETKGLMYTIKPTITTTGQTNQTYSKAISVTGNFNSLSLPLSIFIKYAYVENSSNANTNVSSLIDILCQARPDLCTPQVVYKYLNTTADQISTVNISQQQFQDLWLYLFSQGDARTTLDNFVKEKIDTIETNNNLTATVAAELKAQVEKDRLDREKTQETIIIVVSIAVILIAIVIVSAIIFILKKKNQMEALRRLGVPSGNE